MTTKKFAIPGIGERFRVLADRYGWAGLSGLATATGIPYRSIQNYVREEREPSASALLKLHKEGVNINWLLTGEGRPYVEQYLPTAIVDKILVRLMPDIISMVLTDDKAIFSELEKQWLLHYYIQQDALGMRSAVDILFEDRHIRDYKELREWKDYILDVIAPSVDEPKAVQKNVKQPRKRRQGP